MPSLMLQTVLLLLLLRPFAAAAMAPSDASVTIVIWATPDFQQKYAAYHSRVLDYAERHNHSVHFNGDSYADVIAPPRTLSWGKVLAAMDALETIEADPSKSDNEWVAIIDADMTVNDETVDIRDFLAASTSTQSPPPLLHLDGVGGPSNFFVPTGIFIVKNDPWTRSFLRRWWAAGAEAHWLLDEQHALWHVLLELTPGYAGQVT